VNAPRAELLERVRSMAARVATSYGLEVFDAHLRREPIGWVLRVIVDRPGPPDGGPQPIGAESVTIEDCQRVSQDLSAILDVEGDSLDEALRGRAYTLEVSSPGLDRPLRHEADYRRFAGRLAKIVVTEQVDGQMHFEGRILGVEDGAVLLEQGRRTHRVPVARIARGRLEVEF
jgi:ribosome maturation factor RimP